MQRDSKLIKWLETHATGSYERRRCALAIFLSVLLEVLAGKIKENFTRGGDPADFQKYFEEANNRKSLYDTVSTRAEVGCLRDAVLDDDTLNLVQHLYAADKVWTHYAGNSPQDPVSPKTKTIPYVLIERDRLC